MCTRNRKCVTVGILSLLAFLAGPCAAGPIVYSISAGTQLGVADLGTGAFTPIGSPLPYPVSGIGHGTDGTLYAMDAANNLIRIDTSTGAVTTIGSSNIPLLPSQAFPAVGFAATGSGGLYGVSYDNVLYRFDQGTGAGTEIGSTGIPVLDYSSLLDGTAEFLKGMAGLGNDIYFSSHTFRFDGNGVPTDITSDALYRLNLITGAATKVGDLDPFTWLLGGISGVLYGEQIQLGPAGPSLALFTIDPNTAAAQVLVTRLPMDHMLDGAASVPEPAALLLLGTGLLVLALVHPRHSR